MKIKRLKSLKVLSYDLKVVWDSKVSSASVSFKDCEIRIGTSYQTEEYLFLSLCHELFEACAVLMNVRYDRPDCDGDFLFSFDHRQHDTLMELFAGLLSQFVK